MMKIIVRFENLSKELEMPFVPSVGTELCFEHGIPVYFKVERIEYLVYKNEISIYLHSDWVAGLKDETRKENKSFLKEMLKNNGWKELYSE